MKWSTWMAPPSEEKQNIFQKNERKTVNELDGEGHKHNCVLIKKLKMNDL